MTKNPAPKGAKRKVELSRLGKSNDEDLPAAINRDPAILDAILAVMCHDVLTKGHTFPIGLVPLLRERYLAMHNDLLKLSRRHK